MKAISRKSLTDAAMQSLRTEIMSGRWAVGDQLPNEAALSAKLGVSRGTVREAVRALVAQGMLETRQGSGTYVRSTSDASRSLDRIRHSSLRDRFETRALLETEAARLAALRATPETIAQLEKCWRSAAIAINSTGRSSLPAILPFTKPSLPLRAIAPLSKSIIFFRVHTRFHRSHARWRIARTERRGAPSDRGSHRGRRP